MDFSFDPATRELLLALLAAVAIFTGVVVVAWPYLVRDTLAIRMQQLATERERLRQRERSAVGAKGGPGGASALRREPRKLFVSIARRFNLIERAGNGEIGRMLPMAGYRGNAALVTFLAVRLVAPPAMFALALFYLLVVLQLEQPLVVNVLIALVAGAGGYYLPTLYVKNLVAKRQQSIQRAWPDALDLMLICVESGMGIDSAFKKVSGEIGGQSVPLAEELTLATAELSFLPERRQAFENLSARTGLDSVKAVVASLKQAEKHGTSLGQSLRVLGQENRDMRLSLAEKKAAALPPKLTVPMILFFLPVLFAVIITPAAIQISNMP